MQSNILWVIFSPVIIWPLKWVHSFAIQTQLASPQLKKNGYKFSGEKVQNNVFRKNLCKSINFQQFNTF